MNVDNSDSVSKLCVFDDNSFYKFSALIRKKDFKSVKPEDLPLKFSENKELLIKCWLVENKQQLNKALFDMKMFANVLPCRIYMNLDRKSKKKTLINIRNRVNSLLDVFVDSDNPSLGVKSISKLVVSAASIAESSDKEYRRWLFDVDLKAKDVLEAIEYLCDEEHVATLKTANGFHVIANKTFHPNDRGFQKLQKQIGINKVELKTNAMTLIYKK